MTEGLLGQLADGERSRFVDDALTEMSYAGETWSAEQSVRDLFQNHLDAQMRVQVDKSIERLVGAGDVEEYKADKEFRRVMYLYLNTKGQLSSDAEMEMVKEMARCIGKRSGDKMAEVEDRVMGIIENIEFEPPELRFLVRDTFSEMLVDEVTIDELSKRTEKIEGNNKYRWQIVGLKMSDAGSGYDVGLKSIYDGDKKGMVDQVGKFGEGAKVSDAYLVSRGFKISQRSVYKVKGEEGFVAWKGRPIVSDEGGLLIKGVTVKALGETSTGSKTIVRFPDGESEAGEWLAAYLDPRTHEGKVKDFLCYGPGKDFYYPSYDPKEPFVGVSRKTRRGEHYVGGVRVVDRTETGDARFGYSIFDADCVDGRDRNKLSSKFAEKVVSFWDRQMVV